MVIQVTVELLTGGKSSCFYFFRITVMREQFTNAYAFRMCPLRTSGALCFSFVVTHPTRNNSI